MSAIVNPFVFVTGGGDEFDFTNIIWRVRAADIVGLNDGDDITTWEDASGNNRDFTAGHADNPEFDTNQINGHPAVFFGGQSVAHYLDGPDISGLSLTEIDLFILVKTAADPAGGGVPYGLWQLNNADYANAHTQYPNTSGTVHMTACLPSGQARLSFDFTASLASFRLLRVTAKTGTNNYTMSIDGAEEQSGTRTSLVFPVVTLLGRASDNGGTAYFTGHVAEYFAFSTKVDATQLATIHGYLNDFYGLSLP